MIKFVTDRGYCASSYWAVLATAYSSSMTDISSQAATCADSSTLIPTENIIEDIFAFTNDFWSAPGNHNGPLVIINLSRKIPGFEKNLIDIS